MNLLLMRSSNSILPIRVPDDSLDNVHESELGFKEEFRWKWTWLQRGIQEFYQSLWVQFVQMCLRRYFNISWISWSCDLNHDKFINLHTKKSERGNAINVKRMRVPKLAWPAHGDELSRLWCHSELGHLVLSKQAPAELNLRLLLHNGPVVLLGEDAVVVVQLGPMPQLRVHCSPPLMPNAGT